MLRQCEDTGDVVVVRRLLLFREVPNYMTPGGVSLALGIKQLDGT